MRAILMIGALAGAALGCDRSTPKAAPEPATAQVSQVDAERPVVPEAPSEPLAERPIPTAARGPVDRAAAVTSTFAHIEKGELGQAFKYLADEIVWTEVGLPDGELESVAEIVAFQEKSRTGLSDFRMRAKRILESGDYQVVEYVWSARHSGAFADGTEATNKTVVLPAAMMLRYREDGLIDRVWVFQDWPNALQQLGLAPDLPREFRPFMLPETTEVVLGPTDAAYRDAYEGFLGGLGPDTYRDTLAQRTADDFAWIDLTSGNLVVDHDGSNTYLAHRAGRFERTATVFDATINAGAFFAAFTTNEIVYRGGFMGVPANDQKITTHTLDVVRFDPETLRFETLASYGNSYEILSALGLTAGTASRPEARSGRFAIEACDDYVEHMTRCLESVDGKPRDVMIEALDQQVTRWQKDHGDGMGRDAVRVSCETATEVARRSYQSTCPRVEWE